MGTMLKNVAIPILTAQAIPPPMAQALTSMKLRDPIASLAAADSKRGLVRPWDGDVLAQIGGRLMAHYRLLEAHSTIGPGTLPGILDTVRTRVLQLALRLAEQFPEVDDGRGTAPPPAVVHQIFNNAIISGSNLGTTGSATVEESTVTISLSGRDARKLGAARDEGAYQHQERTDRQKEEANQKANSGDEDARRGRRRGEGRDAPDREAGARLAHDAVGRGPSRNGACPERPGSSRCTSSTFSGCSVGRLKTHGHSVKRVVVQTLRRRPRRGVEGAHHRVRAGGVGRARSRGRAACEGNGAQRAPFFSPTFLCRRSLQAREPVATTSPGLTRPIRRCTSSP